VVVSIARSPARLREAAESETAERSRLMSAFYEDHLELAKGSVTRHDEFTLTKEKLNADATTVLVPVRDNGYRAFPHPLARVIAPSEADETSAAYL
jgi:hypothetical protein